jgi:adenylate cyclase
MNKAKINLSSIIFNLIFWIFLFTFILAIRYAGSGDYGFHQLTIEISPMRIYGNGAIIGLFVGLFYSAMEIYLKFRGIYRSSLLSIIVRRSLLQFLSTAVVLILIAYLNYNLDSKNNLIDAEKISFQAYLLGATILFLFIGAFLGNVMLSIFRTLQMKIGEEIFYDLLTGRFRPSSEQNRAFLFLDLKASTTIAESLGHRKYSFFIQDCFRDLHPAVMASQGEIYQYVGDEAVITWPHKKAIRNNNCLKAFFAFEKELEKRKSYYEKKYGIVPHFKGGISIGKVMTAEVGVIKRDIAYHSDVLNTAARIQGLCNEKNAKLLVSKTLIDLLPDPKGYTIDEKGKVLLRGKNQEVAVFEVREDK